MKRNRLGRTGIVVTDICMGTMTFGLQADEKTSLAIMDRAIGAGIDFFDTAEMSPCRRVPKNSTTHVGLWQEVGTERGVYIRSSCGNSSPSFCACAWRRSKDNAPSVRSPTAMAHAQPANWVGDGVCDDGWASPGNFLCAQFNWDGGDCIGPGCMDSAAVNYNPTATVDDGSCVYDPSPPGEIPDCNGNCYPANWVGDGICDNGWTIRATSCARSSASTVATAPGPGC